MKITTLLAAGTMLLSIAAGAQNVSLVGSATPNGGLTDYTYTFGVSGAGAAVTDLYLQIDDLSPLNVNYAIERSGQPAFTPDNADWVDLGNFSPNTLQFDSQTTSLGDGDQLQVTFSSPLSLFVPTNGHFGYGYDSASASFTPNAGPVVGPTAVPEPGVMGMLCLSCLGGGLFLRRQSRGLA